MNSSEVSLINKSIFGFYSLFSLIFFTLGQQFIPLYFSWDSITIRRAMAGGIGGYYGATAEFYKLLGFNEYSPELYIELFSWIIYIITLLIIFKVSNDNVCDFFKLTLISFYTLVYGFYYATFSKDLILIIFTIIAALIYLKTKKYFLIPVVFFLYGYWYREYWEIIAAILFIFILFRFKKIKIKLVLLSTTFVVLLYNFVFKSYITNIRITANFQRTANSVINNLLPNTSLYTDVINYFYVLLSMIIPIQGLGSFNESVYYLWIWILIYTLIKKRKSINVFLFHFVLIYFSVQACFEPDFGSALRHMLALFLIIYMSIFCNDETIYVNK